MTGSRDATQVSSRIALLYGILAFIAVPWTIYLGFNLPARQLTHHWDISWVGLDILLVGLLLLNAIFSHYHSRWLVMSATATATVLVLDAWLDILSAPPGRPLVESLLMAFIVELPLAMLTLRTAMRLTLCNSRS